jgi:hypothetical protein
MGENEIGMGKNATIAIEFSWCIKGVHLLIL